MYLIVIVKQGRKIVVCISSYQKKLSGAREKKNYRTKDGRKRAIIFSSQENMINLT